MTTDTEFAYQELRAACADLLAARDGTARRRLLAVLQRHLQSRCMRCGRLLAARERADPREDLCFLCQAELIPPPPPGYAPPPDDEVPF